MEPRNIVELQNTQDVSDPSQWFHPALGYAEPIDVVRDDDLTANEKREILAAWASDAYAVDAAPGLRRAPASGRTVLVDDIFEALKALDREAYANRTDIDWARRQLRRQTVEACRCEWKRRRAKL